MVWDGNAVALHDPADGEIAPDHLEVVSMTHAADHGDAQDDSDNPIYHAAREHI
jgi:hypothetical protein